MTTEQLQAPQAAKPKVVFWFQVYCWVLCVMYLAVAAFSMVFFTLPAEEMDMPQPLSYLMGLLFLVMGLVLMLACMLPLLLRPRPWLWTYNLVIICLGMTSACFLPFCIPLLIFWLKPEAKNHFGKE